MTASQATAGEGQYLTFFLSTDEFAVGILQVREIIGFDTVTTIPRTPSWILGVLNLRGHVVPVIDLARKFGRGPTVIGPRTSIVIVEVTLEGDQVVMGILVDGVGQVVDFARADLEPAPAFGTGLRIEFLKGVGKIDRKFVLILDIDRILSADELMTAQATGTGTGGGRGDSPAAAGGIVGSGAPVSGVPGP